MRNDSSTPALILGGSTYAPHTRLGMARTLGRLGAPVYVIERAGRYRPVFYSKYCAGGFFSSSRISTENLLGDLLNVARRIGRRSVLIPTSEDTAMFMVENAERLREQFIFPNPDPDVVRSLCSKKELYHMAKLHDVPTAETFCPRSREELLDFLNKTRFPILLKPIHGAGGAGQVICKTGFEVIEIYDGLDWKNPNVILQEYIPGEDDANWMFEGYFNERSDCLFGASAKSLRVWPLHRGITTLGVCLRNEVVEETSRRFIKAIGYSGMVSLDWRFDADDAEYKLLDFNPRIGSEFRLFVSNNGMDVIRALYLDMTGGQVVPGTVCEGRKWVVENFDLIAALTYMREGKLTLREYADSFRGVQELGCFATDDPFPFVHMCAYFPTRSCIELFSRMIHKPGN